VAALFFVVVTICDAPASWTQAQSQRVATEI